MGSKILETELLANTTVNRQYVTRVRLWYEVNYIQKATESTVTLPSKTKTKKESRSKATFNPIKSTFAIFREQEDCT